MKPTYVNAQQKGKKRKRKRKKKRGKKSEERGGRESQKVSAE